MWREESPIRRAWGLAQALIRLEALHPQFFTPLLVLLPTPLAERSFHEHSFILRARLAEEPCLNRLDSTFRDGSLLPAPGESSRQKKSDTQEGD